MIQIWDTYSEAPSDPQMAGPNRPTRQPQPIGPPGGPLVVSGPTRIVIGRRSRTTVLGVWKMEEGRPNSRPSARGRQRRTECPWWLTFAGRRAGPPRKLSGIGAPSCASSSAGCCDVSGSGRIEPRRVPYVECMRTPRCPPAHSLSSLVRMHEGTLSRVADRWEVDASRCSHCSLVACLRHCLIAQIRPADV